MADFDTFVSTFRDRLKALALAEWDDVRDAAVGDGLAFVEQSKADLARWTMLLEDGALTPEDFTWLVQGKRDLVEMESLKQLGLGLARLDRFRSSLLDTVVGTAFDVFLP